MKKFKYKILVLITLTGILVSSCQNFSDLLEKEDTGQLDLEGVFSDIRNADKALSGLYSSLPQYHNNDQNNNGKLTQSCLAEAYTVYGATTLSFAPAFAWNRGDWSASSGYTSSVQSRANQFGDFYRFDYAAIRACMLFLENIDQVPFDSEYGYGQTEKDQKIGEAKFLAAWFNMDLLRHFGGYTIVDHVLSTTDPEIKGERNTYDQCVKYIVNLCDEAAATLPLQWSSNLNGRATKGAALALKAQALLFSASPLANNPQKPEDSPFRGKYDLNKWKLAAQAAADVIKLNQYELMDDITQIFTTFSNSEVIFSRIENSKQNQWDRTNSPPYIGWNAKNAGRAQMTYNLMKYYKIIKDNKAYDQDDPAGGFDLQNPFVNLDPRFYRDVAFNGSNFRLNRTINIWELGENTTTKDAAKQMAQSNTYLYSVKTVNKDLNVLKGNSGGLSDHNFIFLRYADVLLMYAEAMNEAYGPDVDPLSVGMTATAAINKIRARTKCMNYPEFLGKTYSMPLMPAGLDKDKMRKEIHQERMVEMSWEDHIFYDIRRWKVPVESQQTAYLLRPTLSRSTPAGPKIITYDIVEQPRAFESSWYLLPIPEGEIRKNPNLVQNPGWPGSPEADNN